MKELCCESPCRATPCGSPEEPLTLSAARLGCALVKEVASFVRASDQNLGHLEAQVASDAQELLRQAVEAGAQQKADATDLRCPTCHRALTRPSAGHPRTFGTRFGPVTVRRTRGFCKRCGKWRVPADTTLGLEVIWMLTLTLENHGIVVGFDLSPPPAVPFSSRTSQK